MNDSVVKSCKNVTSLHLLKTFRQNISEQRWKSDELTNSFEKGSTKDHLLCSKEHPIKEQYLIHSTSPGYVLESSSWVGNIAREARVLFLISNFRRLLNVTCFLLGNSPASEFYMPTFRNTLFELHRRVDMKNSSYLPTYENGADRLFRNVGI